MEDYPPKNIRKYESKFKEQWLTNEKYMKWLIKIDEKNVKC